ncbi:MAG: LolA family protein [Desulfobacterales bacterium]
MRIATLFCLIVVSVFSTGPVMAQQPESNGSRQQETLSAEQLLERLEKRYSGRSFTADFRQESTLEAMDIKDEAFGKTWFKHPGKMRWEYLEPENHVIVSDGETLWIYRPEDRQVLTGDAVAYFGNGKGASFLADFGVLKDLFEVSIDERGQNSVRLKLKPRQTQQELSEVYLEINKQSMDIKQVESVNIYGDVTSIFFENQEFDPDMEDSRFEFRIPSGADVLKMEQ